MGGIEAGFLGKRVTNVELRCKEKNATRINDTPVSMSTHSTQILVSNTIVQAKEPALLKEMADSRTGADKMILVQFIVPWNKEMLFFFFKKKKQQHTIREEYQRDTKPTERVSAY